MDRLVTGVRVHGPRVTAVQIRVGCSSINHIWPLQGDRLACPRNRVGVSDRSSFLPGVQSKAGKQGEGGSVVRRTNNPLKGLSSWLTDLQPLKVDHPGRHSPTRNQAARRRCDWPRTALTRTAENRSRSAVTTLIFSPGS